MSEALSRNGRSPSDAAKMLSEMSSENFDALMTIIIRIYDSDERVKKNKADTLKRKRNAFIKMEELRKNSSRYYDSDFDPDQERAEAIKEKYGRFD